MNVGLSSGRVLRLEAFLDEYVRAAGIAGDGKSPLFRSAVRRTGTLAATATHRIDAWRMVQRRAAELGMKVKIGCHTFRATGINRVRPLMLIVASTLAHANIDSPPFCEPALILDLLFDGLRGCSAAGATLPRKKERKR